MLYSDFVIYVDESGDHGLASIDPKYPVFVLTFCIFRKSDYVSVLVPRMQSLKFRWFGHDLIILHENEITRRKGRFAFLQYDDLRGRFMSDLNTLVAEAPMTIIAAVIRKDELSRRYQSPMNPYELALLFCLEKAQCFLRMQRASGVTHIVCEARSPRGGGSFGKEDQALAAEFKKIVAGDHPLQPPGGAGAMHDFELVFASKQANSTGLQLADLTARPIGLSIIQPTAENRAFATIKNKLWRSQEHTETAPEGLKVFP
jgi:hypothetical protein